jgi:hypothetical protein
VFTRALHWSLSWARWIQSILLMVFLSDYPSSYVRVFPVVSFLLTIPPKSYMNSSSNLCVLHALSISSSVTWSFSLYLAKSTKSWSSSLCSFLQPYIISYLLSANILLSARFSNTHRLCSSLNVRDRVSPPYKTTGKIIGLDIFICTLLNGRREGNMYCIVANVAWV